MALETLLIAGLGVLCALVGAGLVERGWERRRIATQLRQTPQSLTSDVTDNQAVVELRGEVLAHPEAGKLEAPFSENACVHREWRVEAQRRSSRRWSSWSTLGEGADSVAFLLADGHGRVRVDLPDIDVVLLDSTREPGVSSVTGTSTVAKEFVRNEIGEGAMEAGLLPRSRRFRETLLRPGDEVYVYGTPGDAGEDPTVDVAIGGFDHADGGESGNGWGRPVSVVSDFSRRRLQLQRVTGWTRMSFGALLSVVSLVFLIAMVGPLPARYEGWVAWAFAGVVGVGLAGLLVDALWRWVRQLDQRRVA